MAKKTSAERKHKHEQNRAAKRKARKLGVPRLASIGREPPKIKIQPQAKANVILDELGKL